MNTKEKKLGAVSKADLALLYFPNESKDAARQSLRRLMSRHPTLADELQKVHYCKNCHILSPIQANIICKCLGNPFQLVYQKSFDAD